MSFGIYVPRDEKFAPLKMTDFIGIALKVIIQLLVPELESLGKINLNEFNSFEDILTIYGGGINLPDDVLQRSSTEMLKEFIQCAGQGFHKYPMPQVIKGTTSKSISFGESFFFALCFLKVLHGCNRG